MHVPLRIWTNASLSPEAADELAAGISGHVLLETRAKSGNLGSVQPSPELEQAEIAFGQPDPNQVLSQSGLRWIHLTSAGYTRYDRYDLREALAARGAMLTNSSTVYADPCAQHALSFLLANARKLPIALASQTNGHAWAYRQIRPVSRVLDGDSVLILGFGAIARRLIELLAPFHVRVSVLRSQVRGDEPVQTFATLDLQKALATADHVVDTLPSSPTADGLIDEAAFAAMKPGAVFYNVGRGATVVQPALVDALVSGRLSAAYLDVTVPEPLPPDDPLWSAPNCFITPHVAGGCQGEYERLVRHFLANLRRYERGEPLADRVM